MSGSGTADPCGAWHFRLVFDGGGDEVPVLEVRGLKSTSRVHEIEEGGWNGHVHRRPDRSRWDDLTIRYATSRSRPLQAWREAFLRDPFDPTLRRSGAVLLLDDAGDVVRSYQFSGAWPVSWEGPSLDGASGELALETLEIAHDGLVVTGER